KIMDSLGSISTDVVAHLDGIIVGMNQIPIVYKGDALFNIAWVSDPTTAEETIQELKGEVDVNPALDDPTTY
ncbi:MAG: succinylglutamate desuccinylase, partial [Proteobacteria bacterium]|nr:succinylglutamate desuccinylase [Pseudomonadota bacterium]